MNNAQTPRRITVVLITMLAVLAGTSVVLLSRHTSSSTATVQGSGVAAAQSRDLATFKGIELTGAAVVVVHVGAAQKVVVHADDNLLRLVTTHVRGGELVIGTIGSFSTGGPMRIDVSVPSLGSVTLSGSGVVVVEGLHADRFTVDLSGSGVLSVSGATGALTATLGGSGDLRLQDLVAEDARALVAGSGRLQVQAARSLDAKVSGVGQIIYTGNPSRITQSVTGTGAVTPAAAP